MSAPTKPSIEELLREIGIPEAQLHKTAAYLKRRTDEVAADLAAARERIAELQATRDAAIRERDEARKVIADVHDALHAECDGTADLPGEIRDLRAELERERERSAHFQGEANASAERADRAEAACAAMRDALERFKTWADNWCDSAGSAAAFKQTEQYAEMVAALDRDEDKP